MIQNDAPYSRVEVLAKINERPERGDFCRRCKWWIPKFIDLSKENEQRLCKLVEQGQSALAMVELRKITGSLLWNAATYIQSETVPTLSSRLA